MKTIAILSSGEGTNIRRIVDTFGAGNRIRIALVVSDRPNATAIDTARSLGIPTASYPRDLWECKPDYIASELRAQGIDLIVTDGFEPNIGEQFGSLFPPRVVTLLPDGSNIRELLLIETEEGDCSDKKAETFTEEAHQVNSGADAKTGSTPPPPPSKTPEEAWAERLGLDYDPERVKITPPPVPAASRAPQSPYHPYSPAPSSNAYVNAAEEEKMPGTYLVWSILSIIFCCLIPGVVALIYSCLVSSRFYAKDYKGARKASEMAQIWIIISIVTGVISAAVYLPLTLFTS